MSDNNPEPVRPADTSTFIRALQFCGVLLPGALGMWIMHETVDMIRDGYSGGSDAFGPLIFSLVLIGIGAVVFAIASSQYAIREYATKLDYYQTVKYKSLEAKYAALEEETAGYRAAKAAALEAADRRVIQAYVGSETGQVADDKPAL